VFVSFCVFLFFCIQASDPSVEAMTNGTEEGQKVTRNGGSKYIAVFRRIAAKD
jgi:tRNA (guanine-N7-)-methyltransferase